MMSPALPNGVLASFGHAFARTGRSVVPLLLVTVVGSVLMTVASFAVQAALVASGSVVVAALVGVAVLFLVDLPLTYGTVRACIRAARDSRPRFSDLFSVYGSGLVDLGLLAVMVSLLVLVGLLLLVLPGVYLSVRLAFAPALVVDGHLGAGAAIRQSWRMSAGRFWQMLGGGLLSVVTLVVGIGLIFLAFVPVVGVAVAAVQGGQLLLAVGVVLGGVLIVNVLAFLPIVYVQVAFAGYYAGIVRRWSARPASPPARIAACPSCTLRIRIPRDFDRPAARCPRCRGVVRVTQPLATLRVARAAK